MAHPLPRRCAPRGGPGAHRGLRPLSVRRTGHLGASYALLLTGVVAGDAGPVAAGRLAPLLAGMLLEEVAHAARGVAGAQPGAVVAREEADGGAGEGRDQQIGLGHG